MLVREKSPRFELIKNIDQMYKLLKPILKGGKKLKKEDLMACEFTRKDGYLTRSQDFEKIQENGLFIDGPDFQRIVQNDFLVTYGEDINSGIDKYSTSVLRTGLVKTEGKKALKMLREYETRINVDVDLQLYYEMVGIKDPLELI